MGMITDYVPNFLHFWGPSFQDFAFASERVGPHDALVLKHGHLERKTSYEKGEKALNRNTWNAFRRALSKDFSSKRIEKICKRYNFNLKEFSHQPLERKFVEYFGVGAATPDTDDLKENLGFFSALESQSLKKIHSLNEKAIRSRYVGVEEDPANVHGGAKYAYQNFAEDKFAIDKQCAILKKNLGRVVSHDPNIRRMHPYYSQLAMVIASLRDKKSEDQNLVIPAPGDIDGRLEYYKIHDIISEGGLTAVAFTPISKHSNLPPILAFRGTKPSGVRTDGIASIFNDLEENIGESGYRAAKEKLAKLMKDPTFVGRGKIQVLGYSLGGAHAGYFMRDFWRQVHEFVGFNSAGNASYVVDRLADEINDADETVVPPSITQHRNVSNEDGTQGDWVNKVGKKHLGIGVDHPNAQVRVVEWIIDDMPAPTEDIFDPKQFGIWGEFHGRRPMDCELEVKVKDKYQPHFPYKYNQYLGASNCNRILDTYNRDPKLENARLDGEYVGIALKWVYGLVSFVLRVFDIDFFERN